MTDFDRGSGPIDRRRARDLFHGENTRHARRLEAAEVPTQPRVVEGAYPGFDSVDPKAPVARRFRDAQVAALARHRRSLDPREPRGGYS